MIDKAERVKMREELDDVEDMRRDGSRVRGCAYAALDALDEAAELADAVEAWPAGWWFGHASSGWWGFDRKGHETRGHPILAAAIRAALEEVGRNGRSI